MTKIVLPHSGYKMLIVYKKSDVIYQGTVVFCRRFLPQYGDRTVDQMTQAARSCKQNIAEGSAAAGTSLETQIKLTNVARATLDELLADFFAHHKDKVDRFLGAAETLVRQSIGAYLKDGRDHLQVAFGCTGNASAAKRSGCLSAKREPRRDRTGPRAARLRWSVVCYSVSSDLGSRRKGMMPMKVTPLRSVQGFSYGSPVTTTFLKLSPM